MKKSLALGGVTLLALALFTSAPANADSPTQSTVVDSTTVTVESVDITTPEQLTAFLESDQPKEITVDTATGDVLTVTDAVVPQIAPRGVQKLCTKSTACLVASATPYANYSFTGKGAHKGSWTNRKKFQTGPYTAKAWYLYNGTNVGMGPKMGPNSEVTMNGPVTAVQVTIY